MLFEYFQKKIAKKGLPFSKKEDKYMNDILKKNQALLDIKNKNTGKLS